MSGSTESSHKKRRRSAPLLWGSGAIAAVVLVLGVNGTLSDWGAAIITNQGNQAGTGAPITLSESGPDSTGTTTTCSSTDDTTGGNDYTCTTINKYGNGGEANLSLTPGDSHSTDVTFTNTSTTNGASFKVAAGACTNATQGTPAGAEGTGNLCNELQVTVACGTAGADLSWTGTPADLIATGPQTIGTSLIAAGGTESCTITTALPSTADITFADLTATQDLTWTLSA